MSFFQQETSNLNMGHDTFHSEIVMDFLMTDIMMFFLRLWRRVDWSSWANTTFTRVFIALLWEG
jgi:hypothetical protein